MCDDTRDEDIWHLRRMSPYSQEVSVRVVCNVEVVGEADKCVDY